MNNIGADKGEHSWKTISTTQKRIKGCAHPVDAAVYHTADCSVAQTDVIATSVLARPAQTGHTTMVSYR